MARCLTLATVAVLLIAAPLLAALASFYGTAPSSATGITGQYVEARTCDVWTGACFANADINLTGKNAIVGWKVDSGSLDRVSLDGLSVVAVLQSTDTLGMEQTGPTQSILIVDSRATPAQRAALIRMAKEQGGDLLRNVVAVESAPIEMAVCACSGNACARLEAGVAHVETRCLNADHDKACGHEFNFYPPLSKNVQVTAAMATEHGFNGQGINTVWVEHDRRGAFVGSFEIR